MIGAHKITTHVTIYPNIKICIILIALKTHDDKLDRDVMEVLKDVIRYDLNDEAHDTYYIHKYVFQAIQ